MSKANQQSNRRVDLLIRDATGDYRTATGEEILQAARHVLAWRVRRGTAMTSPDIVRDFLITKLADLEHEVFVALLLDSQHRLLQYVRPDTRFSTERA
ncbi:MAG TPA: JAB domain-containing protein [Casimicrobiaceae bacterium]|nr:JAB domain-containing protein [Casimicrobiaceae bacterium]